MGVTSNIVLEEAAAEFLIRASRREYLNEVTEMVRNCARVLQYQQAPKYQ